MVRSRVNSNSPNSSHKMERWTEKVPGNRIQLPKNYFRAVHPIITLIILIGLFVIVQVTKFIEDDLQS